MRREDRIVVEQVVELVEDLRRRPRRLDRRIQGTARRHRRAVAVCQIRPVALAWIIRIDEE